MSGESCGIPDFYMIDKEVYAEIYEEIESHKKAAISRMIEQE